MDWQIVIIIVMVLASAIVLFKRFYKTVKKPQSICDSCTMKNGCTVDCDELK